MACALLLEDEEDKMGNGSGRGGEHIYVQVEKWRVRDSELVCKTCLFRAKVKYMDDSTFQYIQWEGIFGCWPRWKNSLLCLASAKDIVGDMSTIEYRLAPNKKSKKKKKGNKTQQRKGGKKKTRDGTKKIRLKYYFVLFLKNKSNLT